MPNVQNANDIGEYVQHYQAKIVTDVDAIIQDQLGDLLNYQITQGIGQNFINGSIQVVFTAMDQLDLATIQNYNDQETNILIKNIITAGLSSQSTATSQDLQQFVKDQVDAVAERLFTDVEVLAINDKIKTINDQIAAKSNAIAQNLNFYGQLNNTQQMDEIFKLMQQYYLIIGDIEKEYLNLESEISQEISGDISSSQIVPRAVDYPGIDPSIKKEYDRLDKKRTKFLEELKTFLDEATPRLGEIKAEIGKYEAAMQKNQIVQEMRKAYDDYDASGAYFNPYRDGDTLTQNIEDDIKTIKSLYDDFSNMELKEFNENAATIKQQLDTLNIKVFNTRGQKIPVKINYVSAQGVGSQVLLRNTDQNRPNTSGPKNPDVVANYKIVDTSNNNLINQYDKYLQALDKIKQNRRTTQEQKDFLGIV